MLPLLSPKIKEIAIIMLTELFCVVDDFCQIFIPQWKAQILEHQDNKRNRSGNMSISEIMTIIIFFHQSNYRNFKSYYIGLIQTYHKTAFSGLVSYPRFVAIMKSATIPLCAFAQTLTGEHTGIYFVDSTLLKVCHIKREKQHKVFDGLAKKAKSTMGWFFGFKLHIVINDKGELMAFKITEG